jgi:RNA 3'-terminal phosphate cyclase
MLLLDGSEGEGGGQILRTALACSLLTGFPFSIEKIRAARRRPGLLPQHLAAVRAATEIANAGRRGPSLARSPWHSSQVRSEPVTTTSISEQPEAPGWSCRLYSSHFLVLTGNPGS